MRAATELVAQLASPAELGRLLTRIENDPAERAGVLAEMPLPAIPAQRIGITGSPGVGKSTLLELLVPLLGQRPAVLAVDPSSPVTGGAVLADRFRWQRLIERGAFVRSLASRGSLGGLSAATGAAARVLEAAGYGPLVIETAGAGQTGFEVLGLADTVVVLLSPESGDALQLLKAGLIEAGDIFAVNKSDRPGAEAMLSDLRSAVEDSAGSQPPLAPQSNADRDGPEHSAPSMGSAPTAWTPPVLAITATTGAGVERLADHIAAHWEWLRELPPEHPRRLRRLRSELEHALRARADEALNAMLAGVSDDMLANLCSGSMTLRQAVDLLTARSSSELQSD